MGLISFGGFTFPENPESYQVECSRQPIFMQNEEGFYEFVRLAGVKRVVSGKGIFTGPLAYDNYGELELLLNKGEAKTLIQPNGEHMTAYLTELSMELDERALLLRYSFTFRESDEAGIIP